MSDFTGALFLEIIPDIALVKHITVNSESLSLSVQKLRKGGIFLIEAFVIGERERKG